MALADMRLGAKLNRGLSRGAQFDVCLGEPPALVFQSPAVRDGGMHTRALWLGVPVGEQVFPLSPFYS